MSTADTDTLTALKKIDDSPWAKPSNALKACYPNVNSSIPSYALYLLGMDRLLCVDYFDPFVSLYAGNLLSSKFPSHVCIFSEGEMRINNSNCLLWAPRPKRPASQANWESPHLIRIKSPSQLVEAGRPVDYSGDLSLLVQEQEFALFVLRASYALRQIVPVHFSGVERLLALDHGGEIRFKIKENSRNIKLSSFLRKLETILFYAMSIEKALTELEAAFDFELATWPAGRARHFRSYFFEVLGGGIST